MCIWMPSWPSSRSHRRYAYPRPIAGRIVSRLGPRWRRRRATSCSTRTSPVARRGRRRPIPRRCRTIRTPHARDRAPPPVSSMCTPRGASPVVGWDGGTGGEGQIGSGVPVFARKMRSRWFGGFDAPCLHLPGCRGFRSTRRRRRRPCTGPRAASHVATPSCRGGQHVKRGLTRRYIYWRSALGPSHKKPRQKKPRQKATTPSQTARAATMQLGNGVHTLDAYRPSFDPHSDIATVVFSHVQCVKTRASLAKVSKLWRDASKPTAAYPRFFDLEGLEGDARRPPPSCPGCLSCAIPGEAAGLGAHRGAQGPPLRVRLRAKELRGSQVGSQRAQPSVGAVSC